MPFVYAEEWGHINQVALLTRTRERRGVVTTEMALLITSLSSERATPQKLLELNRNHWAIENRLHWVRDTVLKEDAAKSRQAHAPQNLAAINSFIVFLLKRAFSGKFTEGIQHCQRKTSKAIEFLV